MNRKFAGSSVVIVLFAACAALRSSYGNGRTNRDGIPTAARNEIRAVEQEIDRIEAEALHRAQSATEAQAKSRYSRTSRRPISACRGTPISPSIKRPPPTNSATPPIPPASNTWIRESVVSLPAL